MKKNLMVLVLLVMWSLLSIASLSSASTTGDISEIKGSSGAASQHDIVIHVTGAADDDQGGDPGDAGDGYGVSDQPDDGGFLNGNEGFISSDLDEFMLILMSLIQLAI